jgi:hypothetical protein
MLDFKLIKPHGHERNKVLMLQAAYNQEFKQRKSHWYTSQFQQLHQQKVKYEIR